MQIELKKDFYSIPIKDISGAALDLNRFKGKKLLVVNVASECGYTPQYKQLQELRVNMPDKVEILGIPCNDFGGQEPGTEKQIHQFCDLKYGVTFPMTAKVKIKGEGKHELYRHLCDQATKLDMESEIKWNFHKFLLDENGALMGHFPSSVSPIDLQILDLIN